MLLAIAIIGLFLSVLAFRRNDGILEFISLLITSMATLISVVVLAASYIGINGFIEASNARYEMLKYQYENGFYENDNDVGKYELLEDIRYWNEDLSKRKALQNDFWIGIFIPDIYDQFEVIDITGK